MVKVPLQPKMDPISTLSLLFTSLKRPNKLKVQKRQRFRNQNRTSLLKNCQETISRRVNKFHIFKSSNLNWTKMAKTLIYTHRSQNKTNLRYLNNSGWLTGENQKKKPRFQWDPLKKM